MNVITDNEAVLMAKAIVDDGVTNPEEIVKEMQLIDDLLTLCRAKSLLTKKRGLNDQLIARLDVEAGFRPRNCNVT